MHYSINLITMLLQEYRVLGEPPLPKLPEVKLKEL